jgi:PAS domain-containing protein
MTEAIVITAADGTVVTVNRAFTEISGYTRDDVLGQSERVIRNALQPPEFYDEVARAVAKDGYWSGTTWAAQERLGVPRVAQHARGEGRGRRGHALRDRVLGGWPRRPDRL